MALVAYHCQLDPHSRSKGHSATAACAYRAGELVIDERTGVVHDYTRRRGVEHTEIFLPENAPEWASERRKLWNAAELSETRKNSTVAREFKVAFPAALNQEQRIDMARTFCKELVQRHGVAVDVAMHGPDKGGDQRNHHAHILFSTRTLTPEGFDKKTRELDDLKTGKVLTVEWKARWAGLCADHLKSLGHGVEAERWRHGHETKEVQLQRASERGDHDYVRENEHRIVSKHIGPNVIQMERRGIQTERMQEHRETEKRNAEIINLAEVRNRIQEARKAYEHDNGNGRDRAADRVDGRTAARAGAEQPRRHTGKPDIGRVGQVPPTFARGRLRNLSELGVVRFPERGEMLLPRDVPRDVEHQRAEQNHELRRGDDGLTVENSASARELLQRELNADLLRRAVNERKPQEAANDPSTDAIKREWQNEKARQFTLIVNRAKELHTRTAGVMERQEGKLATHDQARPQEPSGLFAGFKKTVHDQALTAWRGMRGGLEKRWTQLQGRLHLIGDYMRKAGPYEQPTRGERLAEMKATQARPELAANFQQVIEKEKPGRVVQQRAKIEQRRTGKHQERNMKQESIEELKQRTDTNREKADKAELAKLEKAGHLAGLQQDAEQKYEENQIGKTQADTLAKELNAGTDKGDQTKEEKKRELLERFKDKVRGDRENDRGRGR